MGKRERRTSLCVCGGGREISTNLREVRRGARENEFARGEEAKSERGAELCEGREERNKFL